LANGEDEEDDARTDDDLVLIVEVDPRGPAFRIVEAGGRQPAPVTSGTDLLAGDALRTRLVHAWQRRGPVSVAVDRPEGRYDVTVVPLGEDGTRLAVHARLDRGERRRNVVNAAIVDALPGSVALLDSAGIIRAVNAGWVRYGLERSHDGVLADAGTDYLAVADRAASEDTTARDAAEAIRAVLGGELDMASADYPAETSDTIEWYTMRVAPVDFDGERWAVVSHEDVSALRHALERWHSTFSDAAVPTVIVDTHATIVDANAAFAELVGVDLPSTIRRPALDFVHPDDRGEIERRIDRATREREPLGGPQEIKLVRSDGTAAIVMMHPSAIAPGEHRGAVVQLVELTEQRRAESRLALHRELLELVAAGTPLADVALAVAINIGRALDGATGAVVIAGREPFLGPGATDESLTDAWRVPIDRARRSRGHLLVAPGREGAPRRDELDAAAMLASVVRLALQRDESANAVGWLGKGTATVAVLAVGPTDFDDLLARAGWRGAESELAELATSIRAAVPHAAMITRRHHHIVALVEVDSADAASAIADALSARPGVAVGLALASSAEASADELVDEAEAALAAARHRTDQDAAADDLRRALAAGELGVHYQPIVDLRSGATVSLEALVRWLHPTRGYVPPPELIAVAESCGLIHEVGALVLVTACRDLAVFRAAGASDLTVAVNISARQLADPNLVELVRTAITDAGLDPSALVVEITESAVVDDVDVVAAALAELRTLGVRVAIDDFGTGYSSLLYLKRFPADVLKVDRSFVQGLGVHEGDSAIVDAVVGLGHRLGLEVVAEGVETDEQLAELRRRRCDQAQGYLLQRPVPAAEVDAFLHTGAVELGPEPPVMQPRDLDVDELLSIVTHELSTPLMIIGGHAALLADAMHREDDSQAVIDAIERNIRNLDDLLQSLSGLGQALGSVGTTTKIDLVPFVTQTVNDLGPLLARHDVRTALTTDALCADVDPVAVRQILTNLLSNAVKYTPAGTVVDVDVRRRDGRPEVVVADRGPGVPVEREDELFGRFARLGATERGLGLGLHVSRELARRHGGDLVHERTPSGGATFVLRLAG